MTTSIHVEPNAIPAKLKGSYNGRKFRIKVTDQPVRLSNTFWSGGTRSTYALVDLDTGAALVASGNALDPPQFGGKEDIKVEIPPNHALREHSMFCGEDMGLTFYLRPENAAAFLPEPTDLTPAEQCVLEYTARRKAHYAGENRFDMHVSESRWRDYEPFSQDDWNAAVESLIDRKLLRKNKAITPAGRNAVEGKMDYCR